MIPINDSDEGFVDFEWTSTPEIENNQEPTNDLSENESTDSEEYESLTENSEENFSEADEHNVDIRLEPIKDARRGRSKPTIIRTGDRGRP